MAKLKITPNQITLFRLFFTILPATYIFSRGNYLTNIFALIILYVSAVLDQIDGNLARKYNQKTEIGAWLDEFGDKASQILIIMGISWGVFIQSGKNLSWLLVGFLLIFGTVILSIVGAEFRLKYNFYYDTLPEFWSLFKGKKISWLDKIMKDILAPKNFFSTLVCTYSYFIVVGVIFNIMPEMLLVMAFLGNLHSFIFLYIFIRSILESKKSPSLLISNLRQLRKSL